MHTAWRVSDWLGQEPEVSSWHLSVTAALERTLRSRSSNDAWRCPRGGARRAMGRGHRLWPPHVNRETCTVLIDLAHAFHIPLSTERLSISRRRCPPATKPLQPAFFIGGDGQWGDLQFRYPLHPVGITPDRSCFDNPHASKTFALQALALPMLEPIRGCDRC